MYHYGVAFHREGVVETGQGAVKGLTVLSAEPVARMLGLRGLKAMQLTSAVCASAAIMTPAVGAWARVAIRGVTTGTQLGNRAVGKPRAAH